MVGPISRVPLFLALSLLVAGPLAAQSYRELAREAALKGENEIAVQNYELALNSALKMFAEDEVEIVIRRGELGEAYRAVGRWPEAITQLDYAWRRARFDAEAKKRWAGKEGDLAMGFGEKLGRSCQAAGRYEDAMMVFKTAVGDAERAQRPPAERLVYSALLADTLLLLKRTEEADKVFVEAGVYARQHLANEPPALARVLSYLGMIYYQHLNFEKALPLAQQAFQLAQQHFPAETRDIGVYQSRLGATLVDSGSTPEVAETLLNQARENILKTQTADAEELLLVESASARLAAQKGEFDLSQKHAGEAWRLCKLHFPAGHPETGRCFRLMGDNFVALGMAEDAAGVYARAQSVFAASLGNDHPLTLETGRERAKAEALIKVKRERALKEKAMTEAEAKIKAAAAGAEAGAAAAAEAPAEGTDAGAPEIPAKK